MLTDRRHAALHRKAGHGCIGLPAGVAHEHVKGNAVTCIAV